MPRSKRTDLETNRRVEGKKSKATTAQRKKIRAIRAEGLRRERVIDRSEQVTAAQLAFRINVI
jgi:hypothetical protein